MKGNRMGVPKLIVAVSMGTGVIATRGVGLRSKNH